MATYPEKTPYDIVEVDPELANTPAMTILEAANLQGKSTGLVVTAEFPHATPADFSSHTPSRSDYPVIAAQMVKNNIDVVYGGGINYLNEENKAYLIQNGWEVILGDYNKFKTFDGDKVWGLFAPTDIPSDIDTDLSIYPTLAEMTESAIRTLAKNENGFFLMVEGSKVDWSAHANDALGIITEYLAFDDAVKVAIDFAKKDGNTAVIICPDHGNSGISIGSTRSNGVYSKMPKNNILEPLIKTRHTFGQIASLLIAKNNTAESLKSDLSDYLGLTDITDEELRELLIALTPASGSGTPDHEKVKNTVHRIFNSHLMIGFTTTGHTGEDVFLGMYHPKGDIRTEVIHNTEVNLYMQQVLGTEDLKKLTGEYFAGHKTLFPENEYKCLINTQGEVPVLTITSNKTKKTISLKAYDNQALLNKKTVLPYQTVFVYVNKNDEFYIPRSIKEVLDN